VAIPRAYRRPPGPRPLDVVELFATRVDDYKATVCRVGGDEVAETVARLVAEHGSTSVVAPADLADHWVSQVDATVERDRPPLSITQLDRIDTVVTSAAVAIAETGTVILDAGAGQGRRALTLVPDHHIVIVRTDQVVAGVPDAMGRIEKTAPQTWISGPSATSDIELSRVEGVHGPRHLDVVIVEVG
jgi:L-lactate dehydrogenase complex protein LldG